MLIRRLGPSDASAWLALRQAALRDCPSAFSSSYEEECDTPLATVEGDLTPDSGRNRFGAFDGAELVGMIGVGREGGIKLSHKCFIAGMYIAATHRGKGAGKLLFQHALSFAESLPGVRQVTLTVTEGNTAAVALYASMGFEVYGREPRALFVGGVFHDDIKMVRQSDGRFNAVP